MGYSDYVAALVKELGGTQNIIRATHCATRLRFSVRDRNGIDKEKIKAIKRTAGVIEANGTIQVVIGTHVGEVYEELMRLPGMEKQEGGQQDVTAGDNIKISVLDKALATLSAIFTPYIPVLASAGIIKGVLALLVQTGVMSAEADLYMVLTAAGNSLIYFFPILLAYTAAKVFNANPFIGLAIGAALMEPNLTAVNVTGETMNLFGLQVVGQDFANTVIPIILGMWAYSYLEKALKRYLPKTIQIILVPLISLAVMVPAMLIVFGPVGFGIANGIAAGYQVLLGIGIIPTSILFGAFFIFVIAIGAHWIVLPIQLSLLATQGYEYSLAAGGLGNYAVLGVTLAVLLCARDKEERAMASSAAFVNFLSGVTEPSLYGVIIKNKMRIVAVVASAAVGGLICGIFKCYVTNFAFTGLFGLPAFASSPTAIPYFGAVLVTIALAFGITFIFEKRKGGK